MQRVAQIGQPVPAEQALDGDDQPVVERRNGLQERITGSWQITVLDDLAALVENAQVNAPGMQIDATPESVLTLIEAHTHGLPWAWVRRLSPHRRLHALGLFPSRMRCCIPP